MHPIANATYPVVTHACQVVSVTALTTETYQVELESPADKTLGYNAGQYLQLALDVHGDGNPLPLFYSIANGFNPAEPRRLQLFIQNTGELAGKILKRLSQQLKDKSKAQVTLPMGRAFLQTKLDHQHLLIAAGSGISKIKCITEEILRHQANADLHIYWSNKRVDEFYLLDHFYSWAAKHHNLHFTPILETAQPDWTGRSGYIYEVIQEDVEDLASTRAYLCGSPQMVYGTIEQLKTNGLQQENCYSDVFEYAPRT